MFLFQVSGLQAPCQRLSHLPSSTKPRHKPIISCALNKDSSASSFSLPSLAPAFSALGNPHEKEGFVNGSDFTINVCYLVHAANLRLPSPAPPRSHLLTTQFFSSLLFSWLSFEEWNFLSRTVWLRSAVLFSLSGRHFFSEQVKFSELQRKTEKRSQLHTNRIVLFNNCLKINVANSVFTSWKGRTEWTSLGGCPSVSLPHPHPCWHNH